MAWDFFHDLLVPIDIFWALAVFGLPKKNFFGPPYTTAWKNINVPHDVRPVTLRPVVTPKLRESHVLNVIDIFMVLSAMIITLKQFHKKKTSCGAINQCSKCLKVCNMVKRKKPLFCGEIYCTICNTNVEPVHLCCMQSYKEHVPKTKKTQKKQDIDTSLASDDDDDDIDSVRPMESNVSDDIAKPEKIKDNFLYVFYDLEATQCKPTDTSNQFLHEPNLCVVRQHCAKCLTNFKIEDECENCGQREYIFRGGKCVHEYVFTIS